MKISSCDNTDHKGIVRHLTVVRIKDEFKTFLKDSEPDYAVWCENCRKRDKEFLTEEIYDQ